MNDIFLFSDYKKWVHEKILSFPRKGYGLWSQIAKALRVNNTMVSQIFSGPKDLSLEQAEALARFFSMTELESDYFIDLVQWQRSGTRELRSRLEKKLAGHRERSKNLKDRLPHEDTISETVKQQFYSSWVYTGARMAASLDSVSSSEQIADVLGLPRNAVSEVIRFLKENNLIREGKGGIEITSQRTHLEAGSILTARHHSNWRQVAIEKSIQIDPEELMFTAAISCSHEAFEKMRNSLVTTIESCGKVVDGTKTEVAGCFAIDLFQISKK